MRSLARVKWLKAISVMAVLVLWVLAANHCRLEFVTGSAFLACCDHETAELPAGHHDGDCEDDACAAVEEGLYKTESCQIALSKPTCAVLATFLPAVRACTRPPHTAPILTAGPRPEPGNPWQFTARTALSPRAPSVAS